MNTSIVQSLSGSVMFGSTLLIVLGLTLIGYLGISRAGRNDPDPSGSRAMVSYMATMAFVTLGVALVGLQQIATSLISLIGSHNDGVSYYGGSHYYGDQAARGACFGLLLVVIGGGLFRVHFRRALAIAAAEPNELTATKKVTRHYVALTSYIALLVAALATVIGCYDVLGIIAPGIFSLGGARIVETRSLLELIVTIALGLVVFRQHQAIAPANLRLLPGGEHHHHDEAE